MIQLAIQTNKKSSPYFIPFRNVRDANRFIEKVMLGDEKFVYSFANIDMNDIILVYYFGNGLSESDYKKLVYLEFNNGVYCLPVSGLNVVRATFEMFTVLLKREPTNFFVRFPQDKDKWGVFRHDKKILNMELK